LNHHRRKNLKSHEITYNNAEYTYCLFLLII
jgi:hypothetical protein